MDLPAAGGRKRQRDGTRHFRHNQRERLLLFHAAVAAMMDPAGGGAGHSPTETGDVRRRRSHVLLEIRGIGGGARKHDAVICGAERSHMTAHQARPPWTHLIGRWVRARIQENCFSRNPTQR